MVPNWPQGPRNGQKAVERNLFRCTSRGLETWIWQCSHHISEQCICILCFDGAKFGALRGLGRRSVRGWTLEGKTTNTFGYSPPISVAVSKMFKECWLLLDTPHLFLEEYLKFGGCGMVDTLRHSIIVPGGANNESRGGPGGPGAGFCSPGGGFSDNRRSGKPLRLLRLKNHPRDYKNQYQDH